MPLEYTICAIIDCRSRTLVSKTSAGKTCSLTGVAFLTTGTFGAGGTGAAVVVAAGGIAAAATGIAAAGGGVAGGVAAGVAGGVAAGAGVLSGGVSGFAAGDTGLFAAGGATAGGSWTRASAVPETITCPITNIVVARKNIGSFENDEFMSKSIFEMIRFERTKLISIRVSRLQFSLAELSDRVWRPQRVAFWVALAC